LKRTILIVEDEPSIATLITYNLQQVGYETVIMYDGHKVVDFVMKQPIDFIILDLMLPGMDGLQICQQIRQRGNDVPILMLTAKADEASKVIGLQTGADDYLTKPFSPKELIARIEAIFRRTKERAIHYNKIKIGGLTIFPERLQVFLSDNELELTKKEFDILVHLAKHKGETVSREQLLQKVWGYDYIGDTRTVDMQVSRLREKIEQNSKQPQYIKTVWGFGYKLEDPT